MPAVAATLPKQLISELEERDDVARVYLIDVEEREESDIAMPTNRVPTVWARGFKGNGRRIAILERPQHQCGCGCVSRSVQS